MVTRRQWLEGLAEALPMPVATVDADGSVAFANPALLDTVHRAAGDVLGRAFVDLVCGESADAFMAALQASLGESVPQQVETAVPSGAGQPRSIRWHQIPLLDSHGRGVAVFCLGVDLTARRWSEERLASLNGLLAALQRISAGALRTEDPHELLQLACNSLVEESDCIAAWIVPIGADGRAIGVFECAPEPCSDRLLEALTSEGPPPCIAQALADPRTVHTHAGGSSCDRCPFALLGVPGRTVVAAVTHDDVVCGVLVAHSALADLGDEHKRLFGALADDLGFQLTALGGRAAHARTARVLQEQQRILEAFFDHSLDLAAILDREFDFVRVNRAYADAGARAPEDYIGRNHFEVYPHEENEAIFRRVRDTGEPYAARAKPFEYPDHPEWGVTYWDWQLTPITVDGETELFGLWLRDVTEQERAKQALEAQRDSLEMMVEARTEQLQQTTELLNGIIQASPVAIVVTDRNGVVSAWNPAAERLSGWSAEEAVGRPSELVLPGDEAQAEALRARLLAGEELRHVETVRRHRDGHRLELSMSAAPLRDAAGNVTGVVGIFDDVSERIRAQRELQETTALLQAIIEASPLAIAVHDLQGTVTLWNPAAEVLSGFTAAEAVGRPSPMVPPDRLDEYRRNLATLVAGGGIRNQVFERQRGDGRRVLIELNAAPLRDPDGCPRGNVVIFGDVTEREQMAAQLEAYADNLQAMVDEATAELQASREQLRRQHDFVEAVIAEAAVLVIVVTPDGFIVRFNAACERVSGYRAEEAVGRSFIELLIPQEDRERTRTELERAVGGELVQYENWWLTRLGELRRITWRFANLYDDSGAAAFIVATGLDVTEQRRVEQALAESEELYRQLVQSANSIIVRWDADGTIRFMNDYGLAFFGYSEEELIGQRVTVLVPEVDSYGTSLTNLAEDIIERPQDYWVNENENITRDGRRVWVSWSNRAIRGEDGRLDGIMAIGVDRTLQRQMDLELRRSRENLRTLAARLSAAERRERQEIAGMLHDNLGQLLAFAKMALSAVADGSDQEQAQRLSAVRQYLEEAIAFTRSLTTQLSPPVLSQLGFGAALQWLGDDLEQRHGIAIRVESEELTEVDREIAVLLFQAVREALYNAIKHAQADEVTVRATSKGTHVLIEVVDNGVGFELTSLDVGVGREGGFGLFNIREQLSYLGGHLEIDSEPGAGTRVALLCPPTVTPKRATL